MKAKKFPKQDRKLVASKEDEEREIQYIAAAYKVPIKVVRLAMEEVGINGKPSRSRTKIYAKLREMGYEMLTKYQKRKREADEQAK